MSGPLKRVLISQRCDKIEGRDETRDALDMRFAPILWHLGFVAIPVPNDTPNQRAYVEGLGADAILLSGGNDIGAMPNRDATEAALLDLSAAESLPVFAICRGFQFLNQYQGGTLAEVDKHVATRHQVNGPMMPKGRGVNSYHKMGISAAGLGCDLIPLACAEDGSIEAACHTSLPWLGVMWHPEREEELSHDDMQLMRQHLTGQTTATRLQNGKIW